MRTEATPEESSWENWQDEIGTRILFSEAEVLLKGSPMEK